MLQFVFSGSYLLRWNDKLRPMELQEIDKQAHKLLVAYILFNENSREMQPLQKLILPGKLSKALFLITFTGLSLQTSNHLFFIKSGKIANITVS